MMYEPKDGQPAPPIEALQYSSPDSLEKIRKYYSGEIERGDYLVGCGFAVEVKNKDWFESRFRPVQRQMEMF